MSRTPGSFTKSHPVQNARQRAWNAMRVLKTFTVLHLEISAEIGLDNLKKYLKALHRAGFLRQLRPKRSGRAMGHAIWRLVDCPGPLAPMVRRDQTGVYDPNRDRFIPWVAEETADATAPESCPLTEEPASDRRNVA